MTKEIFHATVETVNGVTNYKVELNDDKALTVDIYKSEYFDDFIARELDSTNAQHSDEEAVRDLGERIAAKLLELDGSVVSVSYGKGLGYDTYASKGADGCGLRAWAELPYWVEAWQMDGDHASNGVRLVREAKEKGEL